MVASGQRQGPPGSGWIGAACRLPDHAWRAVVVGLSLLAAAGAYLTIDTYRPVNVVDAPPEIIGDIVRGRGFAMRFHITRKRSDCPGNYVLVAIGQGLDGVSHQLTDAPIKTFRHVGDPPSFVLQPYFPKYLPAGTYVIRAVVEHACTGLASQLTMMDTAPMRVD